MRILKLALISIVLLFMVSLLISFLIPSKIRISRATNMAGSGSEILNYIRDESSWSSWHPAYMEDETRSPRPEIKTILVRSDEDEVIFSQQQSNKKPVINGFQTYTYAGSDSLTLQWYMDIRLGWFPWQKFSSLFFESTYGTMMEQGLGNLKQRTSSGN